MVEPADSQDSEPPAQESAGPPSWSRSPRRPRRRAIAAGSLLAVAVLVVAVLAWQGGRSATPSAATGSVAPASGSAEGLIAMIGRDGSLSTVDASGSVVVLGSRPGTTYGLPAWSPDGSRIAAIAYGAGVASIAVFAARPDPAASPSPDPVVVFRSGDIPPFYLYWTPDGQRISFLATEADGISLRVAPADGSAPLDGSGPGAVIRRGAPLYFDWINADRLLLHVGSGSETFLGEVGAGGAAVAPELSGAGDFRPAAASADGRFVAFARGDAASAEIVVAGRDGSAEHAVPVVGAAALVFAPTGSTVATIGSLQPVPPGLAFPIGPLRLIDAASGMVRTLLDGSVIAFFWSPDGQTIAALRIQDPDGSTVVDRSIVLAAVQGTAAAASAGPSADPSAGPGLAPSPNPSPDATPATPSGAELHLIFVDVADGSIGSDRLVEVTPRFVNDILPYFDQYALSHRLWAADSSAILLPLVDEVGRDRLVVLPPDGSDNPRRIDGVSGFWSP